MGDGEEEGEDMMVVGQERGTAKTRGRSVASPTRALSVVAEPEELARSKSCCGIVEDKKGEEKEGSPALRRLSNSTPFCSFEIPCL